MYVTIRYGILITTLTIAISCTDENVKPGDVISVKSSAMTINADGKSTIRISGYIPLNALPSNRMITFKASTGSFVSGSGDSVRILATEKSNDKWNADVNYVASLDSGKTTIFALTHGFKDSLVITNTVVEATKMLLTASAFSVKVAYGGELTLTGQLLSATQGMTTKGRRVVLIDETLTGARVGGSFRNQQLRSDNTSKVSAVYSPGLISGGQFIFIKARVLDMNGRTVAKDSVKIYLTQ